MRSGLIAGTLCIQLGLSALGKLARALRVCENLRMPGVHLFAFSLGPFPLRHRPPSEAVRCS
jgi:hypothetical protein